MSKIGQQSHYYPLTSQTVAYTGTAGTISNAVGDHIQVVRITTTTVAFIAIGVSPTATTSDMYMAADESELFTIHAGQKVSAIQAASGGNLHVTEMTQ